MSMDGRVALSRPCDRDTSASLHCGIAARRIAGYNPAFAISMKNDKGLNPA